MGVLHQATKLIRVVRAHGFHSLPDTLVCGENVGASKKGKAEKLDVEMISEDDYIVLLKKG